MVNLSLGRVGRAALDLLYPPKCAVCKRYGAFLCDACEASLPRAEGRRCERCWQPQPWDECANCAVSDLQLSRVRSVYRYDGDVRRIVRAFKFSGHSSLGPALGQCMAAAYGRFGLAADVVVPVPLTGIRRRQRGYNQALLLAREVAAAHGLPCIEALRRKGYAEPQALSVSAEQRWQNVQGVFEVRTAQAVSGRSVLLIDDVATTCSTLDACARVLLEAGAASVSALTLARED